VKVLVTGSSGQLGSYLCELLMKEHDVRGLDIAPQPLAPLRKASTRGDICDVGDARKALRGVDAVVHCAAQVSVVKSQEDPVSDATTNVLGTVNMLYLSQVAGVSKFVYVSSAAVFGNPKYIPVDEKHPTEPMNNYGASKLAGEKFALAFAKTSSMVAVSVRPFNFYSPRADPQSPYSGVITKFVTRLKAGRAPIIEGDGKQTRDFIHARDVAEMIALILEKKVASGDVFNCGTGCSTSVLELADTAIKVSGRKVKLEFTAPRIGDIRDSVADNKKAASQLGFRPRTSLKDGLAEMFT